MIIVLYAFLINLFTVAAVLGVAFAFVSIVEYMENRRYQVKPDDLNYQM